ncbi:MAG: Holliday junction resolvase RecU [Malacoplasma sp.]|nr:Holliday junction resolvase RecU [Malacoplasma sp.]
MYIEQLIEKTIDYYISNNICFIEKRYLPIKIIERSQNIIKGKLLAKSYVDYYGLIESKYVTFESKQTEKEKFLLSQIKEHQFKHLRDINKLKGISFLILHFYCEDKSFLIPYFTLEKWFSNNIKSVSISFLNNEIKNHSIFQLEIVFPGILNIFEIVKKIIDKKN